MSDATPYLEGVFADYIIANGLYVSLHIAAPPAGEVAGGAYARKAVGGWTKSGSNPTLVTNTNIIEWAIATANWGNITHFGVWTAVSGGNLLIAKAVTLAKDINIGDVARFVAGELDINVT